LAFLRHSASCSRVAVARWLAGTGLRVDHFAEEEILTRPQFAELAEYFRATGWVESAALLAAASRFAGSVLAGVDVVVADALVPFVPSLLAMGCSDQVISAFVAELTGCSHAAARKRGTGLRWLRCAVQGPSPRSGLTSERAYLYQKLLCVQWGCGMPGRPVAGKLV